MHRMLMAETAVESEKKDEGQIEFIEFAATSAGLRAPIDGSAGDGARRVDAAAICAGGASRGTGLVRVVRSR